MTIRYPGGKSGAGVFQRIINLIPPHRVYIEPFLGGGAILRRKRPADVSIAIDRDADALQLVQSSAPAVKAYTYIHGDAISFLESYAWRGDEFVYCDPPYLMETRTSGPMYRYEMTDADHMRLLEVLLFKVPAAVMLSGYKSEMYREALAPWHRIDFKAMTRGGLREESLWMNYNAPALLHDDQYLGDNFRERERIKRKRRRWVNRFAGLPVAEQGAIFRELGDVMRSHNVIDSGERSPASGSSNAESDEPRDSSDQAMPTGTDDECPDCLGFRGETQNDGRVWIDCATCRPPGRRYT